MANRMRKYNPGLPLFCGGHSMGALLAALVAETAPDACDAFIFSGLPVSGSFENLIKDKPWLLDVITTAAQFVPKMPLINPTEGEDLSSDPAGNSRWAADPLNYKGRILFKTAAEFASTKDFVSKHAKEIKKPVLFLHGKDDGIAYMSGAELVFQKASSTDKKFIVYDAKHCMNLEPLAEKYYDDIAEFMNEHLEINKN